MKLKKIHKILIALVVLALLSQLTTQLVHHGHQSIKLYKLDFVTVDSETGQAINTAITQSHSSRDTYKPKTLVEMSTDGYYSIVATAIKPPSFTLSAKGYEDIELELNEIAESKTVGRSIKDGMIRYKKIKLKALPNQ